MTPEAAALEQALEAATRIAARLDESLDSLEALFPVEAAHIAGMDTRARLEVDAFLKRFEQLQDIASRQILRLCMAAQGEALAGLSMRDITARMAALGAIGDEEGWFQITLTRNRLAHEYPMSDAARADRLNEVWRAAKALRAQWSALHPYAAALIEKETGE